MRVYVLFHADIEDDRYVRGVFATKALAESQVSVHEIGGSKEDPYFRTHGDWCCGVEEMEVAETAPEVYHGPPPPLTGDPILPDSFIQMLADRFAEPNPYRAALTSYRDAR